MNDTGWNMYVFRDGRRSVRGAELAEELLRQLDRTKTSPGEDASLGALIAAGELECALADAGAPNISVTAEITDLLACDFVGHRSANPREISKRVLQLQIPDSVSTSVAEGFAYYALHPLRFAEPLRTFATGNPVRVIGVRSIGTTLSAVVCALLQKSGTAAERITVRPAGHPYDRHLELGSSEREWLHRAGPDATVVVVDEGPGLSGSSFLSVAESVERAGVSADRIVLLGSREPDLSQLRAPNAAQRWSRYRFLAAAPDPVLPIDASIDLSGGVWRHHFLESFEDQPASWPQLESAKYMTHSRELIYKFHGYGHFADAIANRSALSFDHGFAPKWLGVVRGFGKYEIVSGKLLSRDDFDPELIQRAADYCAFRARHAQATRSDTAEIEAMARWNWQCEFGFECSRLNLPVERIVVADARMLPHEWIRTRGGHLLKLDGSTHGDDHFFPGPCDIAWDLAGMIVEWEMNQQQATEFLQRYQVASRDDASPRIPNYVLAYAIFRMSWSKMAAAASTGMFDEKLLLRDYLRYRKQALELVSSAKQTEFPHAALKPAVAC